MKTYRIKAFGDEENGVGNRYAVIDAVDHDDASRKAWSLFPEYHEILISEVEENDRT